MRFLRRSTTEEADVTGADAADAEAGDDASTGSHVRRGYTPGKGRPTPSRREAEGRRRGPVAPPPRTTREAIRRNRELRKRNPVSKEERRAAARERRERMMAGDERYLLPRDRGPVKAYVRDLVDSRRSLLGLFMPMAVVVFLTLLVPIPAVQTYATLLTTVLLLFMIIEGFLNGRRIARLVRDKFPNETVRGASVGWYAFVRASQIRRLRVPKPRVRPGQRVD
ncbi:DUF3043 domain-containing protein [Saccharomonospora saliphila]|uniref:DUF3043 domain-containing protein n=1 Tax=Saccharomonospora saliphila TaxID=369829 RepID=UPI00039B4B12|nr:DUF3043 domain-containing protein [Saccharomonospora saliphila]